MTDVPRQPVPASPTASEHRGCRTPLHRPRSGCQAAPSASMTRPDWIRPGPEDPRWRSGTNGARDGPRRRRHRLGVRHQRFGTILGRQGEQHHRLRRCLGDDRRRCRRRARLHSVRHERCGSRNRASRPGRSQTEGDPATQVVVADGLATPLAVRPSCLNLQA